MAIQQRLLDADARPEVGLGDDLIHCFRNPDVALDMRQRLERGRKIAQLCQAALARLHVPNPRALDTDFCTRACGATHHWTSVCYKALPGEDAHPYSCSRTHTPYHFYCFMSMI